MLQVHFFFVEVGSAVGQHSGGESSVAPEAEAETDAKAEAEEEARGDFSWVSFAMRATQAR